MQNDLKLRSLSWDFKLLMESKDYIQYLLRYYIMNYDTNQINKNKKYLNLYNIICNII